MGNGRGGAGRQRDLRDAGLPHAEETTLDNLRTLIFNHLFDIT